ncbi:MAG: gliding motility lipoprotein GldH [Bacteroidota bacterium]
MFLILASCHPNRVFDKNIDVPSTVWEKENIYELEFDISDPSLSYNIYFNLRNSVSYPFQNLYMEFEMENAEGNVINKELKNFELFDPKTGKPYGDGLGDLFDHRFLLLESYQFEKEGTYTIRMEQFMRVDNLPSVVSIGVMVEKASSKE